MAQEYQRVPYIIDTLSKKNIYLTLKGKNSIFWDYLNTFLPPIHISNENEVYQDLEELDSAFIEYKYVAFKFGETFKGRERSTLTIKQNLKQVIICGLPIQAYKILRIQKIINLQHFKKFNIEFHKDMIKYQFTHSY